MKKNADVPITVTFRHLDPSDALRQHAEKKLAHVIGVIPGATDIHVILSTETHHRQKAEFVVHASHTQLTAHAETGDMYAAIDQAVAKLDRQARKLKERVVEEPRRGGGGSRRGNPSPASAGND